MDETTASGEVLTEADAARLAEEFERDDTALTDVTFPRQPEWHCPQCGYGDFMGVSNGTQSWARCHDCGRDDK